MIEAYIVAVQLALTLVVPILLILTLFMVYEAFRYWPYKLPTAIALHMMAAGAAATWLVWAELYYARVGPVPEEFGAFTATAILVLCFSPVFAPIYFLWLTAKDRA